MADGYTQRDYWQDVRAIAAEIVEAHPDPDDDHNDRCDRVHQDCDGSAWIIYTHAQRKVLDFTDNTPDGEDVAAMSDGTWDGMQTVAAFLALEGDVYDAIRVLDAEREEAEEAA